MSTLFLIAALILLSIFTFGVLTGSGLNTRVKDARERRQAAIQRELNEQRRELEIKWEANRLFQQTRQQPNDRHDW